MCQEPYACCGAGLTCTGGVWTASTPLCNQPCLSCGATLMCNTLAVCVHVTSGGDYYQCAKDPCSGTLDCTCAQSVCAASSLQCTGVQAHTVTCG
jgi:hypothetical protein